MNKKLYDLTREFLNEERFGLVSQIRRASISASSNFSEGVSRNSPKAQANYSEIAFGSLMEVMFQLILSFDLGYLDEDTLNQRRQEIEKFPTRLIPSGRLK